MIYFFDEDKRYIGCRELKENEIMPTNCTLKEVEIVDGQMAYYLDEEWVIEEINKGE